MIEAVIDTNVFIDAILRQVKECQLLLRKEVLGEVSFAMSVPISDELSNSFFDIAEEYQISRSDLQKFVVVNLNRAILRSRNVTIKTKSKHSADPEDDKFIHCAIDGGVRYIVSSDNEGLLALNQKIVNCNGDSITIIKPKVFLEMVNKINMENQMVQMLGPKYRIGKLK